MSSLTLEETILFFLHLFAKVFFWGAKNVKYVIKMIKTTDNGIFSICIGTQYSFQCGRIGYQSKFLITLVDPLTPRAICQKMHFFGNLDFSILDISQISYLLRKAFATRHCAFLSTYIVFMTMGMRRNQNFEFLDEKVTYIFGLFIFF